MTFAVGEEAAYTQPSANANYMERNGDFVFGVVAATAGGPPPTTVDILWSNGNFSADLPIAALDKINPGASTPLFGKVVRPTGPVSAQFTGAVIRTYTRQPAGTGTETELYALVKLTNTDTFIEILASQLEVVPG